MFWLSSTHAGCYLVVVLWRLGACGGSPAGWPQGGLLLDVPLAHIRRQPVRAAGQGGDVPDHDSVRRIRGTQLGAVGGESQDLGKRAPNLKQVFFLLDFS